MQDETFYQSHPSAKNTCEMIIWFQLKVKNSDLSSQGYPNEKVYSLQLVSIFLSIIFLKLYLGIIILTNWNL